MGADVEHLFIAIQLENRLDLKTMFIVFNSLFRRILRRKLEEDTSSSIPVGETEDGEIHELGDGTEGPVVSDRVQIQLRQE